MTEIPQFLDGARVLATADIGGAIRSGQTRHVVDGLVVDDFAGLAIAQYDASSAVYLFYCDVDWNVITDTYHASVAAAHVQASEEFGPVEFIEFHSSPTEITGLS
ncbi:hypothetical protein [Nocardia sp. XZ_19_369]|uniref:hypothetical protein n=1 Tax=Nocardia sp. XZ_19_369 TaxID=2769487 RepID=UPI00189096A3|nr:hypothetical protein [Nocardia sp. XZ_19_369]